MSWFPVGPSFVFAPGDTAVTMAASGGTPVHAAAGYGAPGLFTVGLDGLALAGLAAQNQAFVGRMDHAGVPR